MYEVVRKDPSTGTNLSKATFAHDGWGRVVITREYSWVTGAWQQTSEKRRIYDGMDVVQERDASNNVIVNYTREGNIGGILGKTVEGQGGNPDQNFYFHYDGSGNVTQLTDASENTVAEYKYDPFGNLLSSTGAQASANSYRFSTKEYNAVSGLYNYGYRFYSSGLGRWISRDPLGEAGGLNLYGFVSNNPTNMGDLYGLWGIQFGEGPNIGVGAPSFIIDQEATYEGGQGSLAFLDEWNPFGDPYADLGYYDLCDQSMQRSHDAAKVALTALSFYLGAPQGSTTADGLQLVTHWGPKGMTVLKSGNWVMKGGPSLRNWLMSGAPEQMVKSGFQAYRIGQRIVEPVAKSALQHPTEFGKAVLGQRLFIP